MSETKIEVGNDYMDFVTKFHQAIKEHNIVLVYEGEVTQNITKAFTSMTEEKLEDEKDSTKTQKRVYHVMVECLQNVCKHADHEDTGLPYVPGKGIFIVSNSDDEYVVTTGNVVNNEKKEVIEAMLERFNNLSEEEIKEEYKKMIKESRLSEKAGAGLGFIDIVKKTGNQIEYAFKKINDKSYFFIQKSIINRD